MIKFVRYDARLNAQIVLEQYVIEEWYPGDNREFSSRTNDNTEFIVYPERREVKIVGDEATVSLWQDKVGLALGSGVVGSGIEPAFFDPSIFEVSRPYIRRIGSQINICYSAGAYDAAAILLRKVIESLLIECFETKGIDHKIKNQDGSFNMLDAIITKSIQEHDDKVGSWNLGRTCRDALPSIKELGDSAAHARRFSVKKGDIDRLHHRSRVAIEELIELAGIGK